MREKLHKTIVQETGGEGEGDDMVTIGDKRRFTDSRASSNRPLPRPRCSTHQREEDETLAPDPHHKDCSKQMTGNDTDQ